MKKKQQILLYHILIYGCALAIFLTGLITKQHILTPFGFILLIGGTVIRFLAKRETTYTLKEVQASEIAKPKLTINQAWEKFWERFINWLNN